MTCDIKNHISIIQRIYRLNLNYYTDLLPYDKKYPASDNTYRNLYINLEAPFLNAIDLLIKVVFCVLLLHVLGVTIFKVLRNYHVTILSNGL